VFSGTRIDDTLSIDATLSTGTRHADTNGDALTFATEFYRITGYIGTRVALAGGIGSTDRFLLIGTFVAKTIGIFANFRDTYLITRTIAIYRTAHLDQYLKCLGITSL
jgi:hypothetical protein